MKKMMNKFEFPYNFDKQIIDFLKILDPKGETIECIYLPPFLADYKTILRESEQAAKLSNMSQIEYIEHIKYINKNFPNKIQLLLQKQNQILSKDKIIKYINLGIQKFCVGSIEQAKIIKEINSSFHITGSITMNINKEKLLKNLNFKYYFDDFVLPFYFCKSLNKIKELPNQYNYILLINATCNNQCQGTQHWNHQYLINEQEVLCPGLYDGNIENWNKTTLIRPMDLKIFKPYIKTFKLQDRGWPTNMIIKDYILYSSNYEIYPGIEYKEEFYL